MQIKLSCKQQIVTICIISLALIIYIFSNKNGLSKLISTNYHGDNLHFSVSGFAKVIDGDSIIVNKHEIRILHIDAPEYTQTCHDQNEQEYPCGQNAKKFLEQQLKNHPTNCKIQGKDKYKRFLASCTNNQQDISKLMIRNGQAILFNQSSFYYKDQEHARLNKIGIWQGKFLVPRTYRKLHFK